MGEGLSPSLQLYAYRSEEAGYSSVRAGVPLATAIPLAILVVLLSIVR